jgi:hypothetical protein
LVWIISNLVGESLEDFEGEITEIVKAIGFSFNDFNLVIDPFYGPGDAVPFIPKPKSGPEHLGAFVA